MPHSAAETQFTLGMNMLANGNRERAIEYFNKARELDTSNAMRDRVEAALEGKPIKSTESKENK
jgi:Flp pilus assembly protein TadD